MEGKEIVRNFDRAVCILNNYGKFKSRFEGVFTETITWTTA